MNNNSRQKKTPKRNKKATASPLDDVDDDIMMEALSDDHTIAESMTTFDSNDDIDGMYGLRLLMMSFGLQEKISFSRLPASFVRSFVPRFSHLAFFLHLSFPEPLNRIPG